MGTKQPYRTRVEDSFQERWGPIESRSRPYCFSHYTGYYEKEMGKTLWKYFFTLENLLPMDSLKEVKLFAEQLEKQFACKHEAGSDPSRHRRTVNLDPGYLSPHNLVLSTAKSYAHRIYLGEGVSAEVTLLFRKNGFQSLPWTYPDYAAPLALGFFTEVRGSYMRQLAALGHREK